MRRDARRKCHLATRKSASNDVLFCTVHDAAKLTGDPPATGTIDSNDARTFA